MVVDPLERRVGEDEIEPIVEPGLMSPCANERPGVSAYAVCARASIAGDASMPTVSSASNVSCRTLVRPPVPQPRSTTAPAGHGMTEAQEVVERLLTFRSELLVLVGAPPVNRRHGHRSHV